MKIFFCLFLFTVLPPKYKDIFGGDYDKALAFYEKNQTSIATQAAFHQQNPDLLAAIVFPEWIRYSAFQDFFETETLEYLYIENGTKYADFSIGNCQMKPSFIEKIEQEVAKNENLTLEFPAIILQGAEKEKRKIRLERLKNLNWQIVYLSCFVCIIHQKFPDYDQKTMQEQVKFYATAYNWGWHDTEEKILAQSQIASFPYGNKNFLGKQYQYAEVAIDFWQNQLAK